MRLFLLYSTLFLLLFAGCLPSQKQAKQTKKDKLSTVSKNRNQQKRNARKIESNDKLAVKSVKVFDIKDIFYSEQKRRELRCPDKNTRKRKTKEAVYVAEESYDGGKASTGVRITRSSSEIHFDIIELKSERLDIPAFKQFRNNMTDFTADGETEFLEIIEKIRVFLGDNTDGGGVSLRIIGSASQIPTSFDPDKPNNNINPDGSSIYGQTSVENNRKLAMARANELAKKIKAVFKNIIIITPALEDIAIGELVWDKKAQQRLNHAVSTKNEKEVQRVFEPYQKDQFVKVESEERIIKRVKPNSIRMYTVYMPPRVMYKTEGKIEMLSNVQFIVSRTSYESIAQDHYFETIDLRQDFLDALGLSLYHIEKNNKRRWYLLTQQEAEALLIQEQYDRILEHYYLEIVDDLDKKILEQIIRTKYLKLN